MGLAHRAHDRYRSYSMGMKQRLGIAAPSGRRASLLVLRHPRHAAHPRLCRLMSAAPQGALLIVTFICLDEVSTSATTW